jgi:hypothetical protein
VVDQNGEWLDQNVVDTAHRCRQRDVLA